MIRSAIAVEDEINTLRNELRAFNLTKLGDAEYNVEASMIFNNVYSSLEKVGDHIINVTEAVVGEI